MLRTLKTISVFSAFAAASFAQDITPLQFKRLCETSPLNTIVLRAPTKILGTAPAVTVVNSGCRVNFLSGAKLEADQASFEFAGPLVFQAGPTAEINLVKSLFVAPAVQVTEGQTSILNLTESTVQAQSGNITIALGASGQVTASSPYAGMPNALEAAGAIAISGGARSTFSLVNASATAGTNFGVSFAGTEGKLHLQDSTLMAGGPLSVIAPGTYGQFDISSSQLNAGAGITLSARGTEGKVIVSQSGMNGGAGSVSLTAGVGTAGSKSAVKVSSTTVVSGGSVTVLASRNASEGESVVEVSTIEAQGDIRIESGNIGTTTALNNGLTSTSLVRVFAPANGSCVAENNTVAAPLRQLCR
jgi:hypothetical protein